MFDVTVTTTAVTHLQLGAPEALLLLVPFVAWPAWQLWRGRTRRATLPTLLTHLRSRQDVVLGLPGVQLPPILSGPFDPVRIPVAALPPPAP